MTPQTVPGNDDGGLFQGLVHEELHGALGQVVHDRGLGKGSKIKLIIFAEL